MGWLRDRVEDVTWAVENALQEAKYKAEDICYTGKDMVENALQEAKYKAEDIYYTGKDIKGSWNDFTESVSPTRYVEELNQINEEMKTMIEKTQERVAMAQKNSEAEYSIANSQMKAVFEKTLPYFERVFSKLKEVEFDNELVKLEDFNKFELLRLSYKNNSIRQSFVWKSALDYTSPAIVLTPITLGAFFVENAIKSTLLETKIEKAKVEYAKLKKECEEAKTSCVRIESLTQALNRLNGTVRILKKLTENLIKEVESIEKKSGYIYSSYTKEEKDTVMMMYNFTMALNDLVIKEVIDKNGKIHPNFEKFVGEAEQMIGSNTNG